MLNYLWIGLGGFMGANARYLLQLWAANRWGTDFPYGTLLVNVSGCAAIGFLMTLFTGRLAVLPEVRLFVVVGFLGGFTTFSSFAYETARLVEPGGWWVACLNFLGNTVLGLVAVMVGMLLAQWL